jgi:hypothetical protein
VLKKISTCNTPKPARAALDVTGRQVGQPFSCHLENWAEQSIQPTRTKVKVKKQILNSPGAREDIRKQKVDINHIPGLGLLNSFKLKVIFCKVVTRPYLSFN